MARNAGIDLAVTRFIEGRTGWSIRKSPYAGELPKSSSPWCSPSLQYWRVRATLPLGFILSPSATLRVAGLAPRVKVEHPTV